MDYNHKGRFYRMRKSLRFYIALWSGKLTAFLLRLMHRNATHLPGLIATRLCPDFLGRVDKPQTIIAVTGTNGKTTVCNLLDDILPDCGVTPLNNRAGGNITEGLAATFLNAATLGGHIREELAVLEIDERCAVHIFKYIEPDYLIVTNLFRDSMRRNAHAEYIADILSNNIPAKTKLIVNADDLISSHLAPHNPRVAFGIAHREDDWETPQNIVCDIVACPQCNAMLQYDFVRYNHIGRAHCPQCDFASLTPAYELLAVDGERRVLTLHTPVGEEYYRMIGDNITDWYNTLAAVTLLREMGYAATDIERSLQNQKIVSSRFDRVEKNGKTVTTLLSKAQNPIACSRSFDFIRRQDGRKAVILLIGDFLETKHGSENVAWLYDADFEFLSGEDIVQIVTAGTRTADIRLRLLLAGIPDERITCIAAETAVADTVDLDKADHVYILNEVHSVALARHARERLEERLSGETKEATV